MPRIIEMRDQPRRVMGALLSSRARTGIMQGAAAAPRDAVWDGGGANDNWFTADNWVVAASPAPESSLTFSGSVRPNPVNNYTADTPFHDIIFAPDAVPFTLTGNRFELTGDIIQNDDDVQTVALDVLVNGVSNFYANSGTLVFSGDVAGSGSLNITGGVSKEFHAVGTWTFAGAIEVDTVCVLVTNSNGLGSGQITLNGGGLKNNDTSPTLNNAIFLNGLHGHVGAGWAKTLTLSGVISGTGEIQVTYNNGTVVLSGTNTYTGKTVIGQDGPGAVASDVPTLSVATIANSGVNSNIGAGSVIEFGQSGVVCDAILLYTGANTSTNRTVSLAGAAGSVFTIDTANNMDLAGVISGTGDLEKEGAGVLSLLATNTFTGALRLTTGTVQIGNGTTNGSVAAASSIVNGTTLIFNTPDAQSTTFNNVISGAGVVTKKGLGTANLGGANTYTGATDVEQGTLVLAGRSGATDSATLRIGVTTASAIATISGGTFVFNGNSIKVGSGFDGTLNQSGGDISFASGDCILVGESGTVTGTCNISGGTITLPSVLNRGIILGASAGCVANFNLSGTAVITGTTDARLQIGRYDASADNCTALFAQTGGSIDIPNVNIGGNGITGTGLICTVNLSGGVFVTSSISHLAAGDTNTCTINVSGTADVTLPELPTTRGTSSTATITTDGGTIRSYAASATWISGLTNFYIKSGGVTFAIDTGKNVTIPQDLLTDPVSTGGGLTKSGTGTLTFTGTNTYTGATTISAGTLQLGGGGATGGIPSTSSIVNNGVLIFNMTGAYTYSMVISGTGSITKQASGTLTLGGVNTYSGGTVITGGIVKINADSGLGTAPGVFTAAHIQIDGGTLETTAGFTLSTNRGVTVGAGNAAFTLGGALAYAGRFTGPTRMLTTSGSDLSLTNGTGVASNVNFTISSGRILFSSNNALGTGSVVISNGATLVNNTGSSASTVNNSITLQSGAGISSRIISAFNTVTFPASGTVIFNSDEAATSELSIYSNFGVTGALTVQVGTVHATVGNAKLAGVISGVGSLVKTQTGTLVLGGNNTFQGGTTHNAGIINAEHSNAFGTGTVTTASGAVRIVLLDGINVSNNFVIGAGYTPGAGRGFFENTGTGTATISGTITINGAKSGSGELFRTAATGKIVVTGAITSSAVFGLRLGFLRLDGGGSYASFLIDDGTLQIGAANGIATNATVEVGSGAGDAYLDLNGYDQSLVGITTSGSAIVVVGNSSTVSDSTLTITGTPTWGGVIADVIGSGTRKVNVVINSSGTVIFTGANTFTGTTTVSAGTLQIGSGGTVGSIVSNIAVSLGATLTFNRSDASTYAGVISGAGNLTKLGAGTLTLTGTNTISGVVTISAGAIQLGNAGTTGTITSVASITNNASLIFNTTSNQTYSMVISGTGSVTKQASGTLTLSGNNTFQGGVTSTGGIINVNHANALGTGTWEIATGSVRNYVQDGVTISNAILISGGNPGNGQGQIQNSGAGTATLAGPITITGGGAPGGHFSNFGAFSGTGMLNITGAITSSIQVAVRHGLVQMSGGGSYTSIVINIDTLRIGANNGLATNATLDIGTGTFSPVRFDLNGYNQSLAGITKGGTGATIEVGNSSTTSDSTLTITGTPTYAGAIVDVIGSGTRKVNITINSSGTVIFTGTNTYTGVTTISGGTLQLGNNGTTGTILNCPSIVNNSELIFHTSNDQNYTSTIISGTGAVRKRGTASAVTLFGTQTYSGITYVEEGTLQIGNTLVDGSINNSSAVVISSGAVLSFSPISSSGTYPNVISGTGGIVSKAGAGTTVLSGANTYTGTTTIYYGTLQITGSLGNTAVTVSAVVGASTLLGPSTTGASATITGSVTVANTTSANIQPGSFGNNTLNTGALTFSGSNARFTVNSTTTTMSKIAVTGNVALGGCGIILPAGITTTGTYKVITATGTMSGTLPTIVTNNTGRPCYVRQTGNDLEVLVGWSPADITTAAWYDAADASTITESGGAVSQWNDKSGNARHATQGTAANKPTTGTRTIGGLNALDFDGGDYLSTSYGVNIRSNDLSVFAVVLGDVTDTTFRTFIGQWGVGVNRQWVVGKTGNSRTQDRIYSEVYNTQYVDSTVIQTTARVISAEYDNTSADNITLNLYVDGSSAGTNTATNTQGTSTIVIGGATAGSWDGPIAEIIVVASILSTADRQKIEGYLAWKWGLVANLPGGHPYKSVPPM